MPRNPGNSSQKGYIMPKITGAQLSEDREWVIVDLVCGHWEYYRSNFFSRESPEWNLIWWQTRIGAVSRCNGLHTPEKKIKGSLVTSYSIPEEEEIQYHLSCGHSFQEHYIFGTQNKDMLRRTVSKVLGKSRECAQCATAAQEKTDQ